MSNLNVNNLTSLAGHGGTIGVSSSLNVSGSITLTGNVTANGNIVLGDNANDRITFDAKISSSLIPNQNSTNIVTGHDLGATNRHWNTAFIRVVSASHSVSASLVQISKNGKLIPGPYANNYFFQDNTYNMNSSNGGFLILGTLINKGDAVFEESVGITGSLTVDDNLTVEGTSSAFHLTSSKLTTPIIDTLYLRNSTGTTTHLVLGDTTQLLSSNGLLAVKANFTQHVTASGTVKAEHLLITDDAVIQDDLTAYGKIQAGQVISGSDVHATYALSGSKARIGHNLQVGNRLSIEGMPNSEATAASGQLYALSGSQIFTGSAFIQGHADQIFASPGFSSSLFVFQKA